MGYMPFKNGNTANDSDFVIGICEILENSYGVKFINSFRDIGLNKRNAGEYTTDGTHPNAAGGELYWRKVIERNNII